jgi:CDP-diacylglycerol--serine O-phosphatidyltransferase
MGYKIRLYFPNVLTFISLSGGLASIVLSSQGFIYPAALSILASVVLDTLDGYFARKLNVDSKFGMQLDSLADIVCFGVAPVVLLFQHLMIRDVIGLWFMAFLIVLLCTGAFRLARFNLQPPKESSTGESLGLTITSSGITISLTVLSDLSNKEYSLPLAVYLSLIIILSYLMVSKLKFPGLSWFIPVKGILVIYGLLGAVLLVFLPIFTSLLIFCLGIMAASISRNLYLLIFRNQPILQ